MSSDLVMLSIRPDHASQIFTGDKRAELRKSFPPGTRVVFLYETLPVSAVTGAFVVREAVRAPVPDAVALAEAHGVDRARAQSYYGERSNGWVVRIGLAARFDAPVRLDEMRRLDHYFSVPQTFAYLERSEALAQTLLARLVDGSKRLVSLRPMSDNARGRFESLMLSEVGDAYADIDDDFVDQVLREAVGLRAAFSTKGKHVLEAVWGDEVIGFTVLTEKWFGAWKSGPSILLPEYRGFGLGQVLRARIEDYCTARRAIGVYCTCSESKPQVVAYLLNSGMKFQARLREHLSAGRDELVFARKLVVRTSSRPTKRRHQLSGRTSVTRLSVGHQNTDRVLRFFLTLMPDWYFRPPKTLRSAIAESMRSFEQGSRRYSDKARALYALVSDSGRPRAACLVTEKRSAMLKVNIVSDCDDVRALERLLRCVVRDAATSRRVYLTLPARELPAFAAASRVGFRLEGVLTDPFGVGIDHLCLGLVTQHKRSRPSKAKPSS